MAPQRPKWVAAALLAAVLATTGWVGWLAMERLYNYKFARRLKRVSGRRPRSKSTPRPSTTPISHRSGEIDDAKAHYKKALEQDAENQSPAWPRRHSGQEEDWARARSSLNALGSIVPDPMPLQGLILNKLGKREAARAELHAYRLHKAGILARPSCAGLPLTQ